jgi:hypothetical protein
MHGGALDFRDAGGGAAPALVVRRAGQGLQVVLGDQSAGARTLQVGTDSGAPPSFAPKLTVDDRGDLDIRGRLDVTGDTALSGRLDLVDPAGVETDPLSLAREHPQPGKNDLKVTIGRDEAGDDRLLVGPVRSSDGSFREKLSLANDGTLRLTGSALVSRDLTVGAGALGVVKTRHVDGKHFQNDTDDVLLLNWATGRDVFVGGGSSGAVPRSALRVAGDATVGAGANGVLRTRHVDGKDWQSDGVGDLHLNWGTGRAVWVGSPATPAPLTVTGDLLLGATATKVPVDVMSGEVALNATGGTGTNTGTVDFALTSRLAAVSDATCMVALSDVSNEQTAVWARWRVQVSSKVRVDARTFRFFVTWQVDDVDGHLHAFSYLVVFVP